MTQRLDTPEWMTDKVAKQYELDIEKENKRKLKEEQKQREIDLRRNNIEYESGKKIAGIVTEVLNSDVERKIIWDKEPENTTVFDLYSQQKVKIKEYCIKFIFTYLPHKYACYFQGYTQQYCDELVSYGAESHGFYHELEHLLHKNSLIKDNFNIIHCYFLAKRDSWDAHVPNVPEPDSKGYVHYPASITLYIYDKNKNPDIKLWKSYRELFED